MDPNNRPNILVNAHGRILRLLMAQGPISSLRLAQASRLRLPEVSRIVSDLKALGLLRHARLLSAPRTAAEEDLIIHPFSAWSAGLSLHTGGTTLFLVNAAGQIVARQGFPWQEEIERFIDDLGTSIEEHAKRLGLVTGLYSGLGVSVPGVVNPRAGTVSNLAWKWNNFPLCELLAAKLGFPARIERDATCGAYGEMCSGRARNWDNFLYFLIQPEFERSERQTTQTYQYAATIVINGRILSGSHNAAGLLRGILILDPMMREVSLDPPARAAELKMRELLHALGRTIAALVNLLDPKMVVLCGQHRLLIPERLALIDEIARNEIVRVEARAIKVLNSAISLDGLPYGAAMMSLHNSLEERIKR